ncbi:hypothetical protein [Streptomonospora salina]|uniref:Uncharacterized protein n=1 Tax=Streptomonospora salina TaxID=104205 RepID=A0A841ED48_9ACTN|nr:hypothetical protein [Streptomonospora salina]MBB5998888.1 hypothetical protein [Streptomonospora salina]
MSVLAETLTDPLTLFVLVGLATQTAVTVDPEIVWRRRGRNRLDALPPRLAAVFLWTTRISALVAIVVLVAFLFI